MHTRWIHCAGLIVFALSTFGGSAMASDANEPFVFNSADRRDPFTFALSIPTPPLAPIPSPTPNGDWRDFEKTRTEFARLYELAEREFLDAKWGTAQNSCDQALAVLRSVPEQNRSAFGREETAVLRLHSAVDRLIIRDEAQRQFDALNISLTGVVARTNSAQAIVNSKVVSRGNVVPVPNAPQDVVVLDIRSSEVVFGYRGFRMIVGIKEGVQR